MINKNWLIRWLGGYTKEEYSCLDNTKTKLFDDCQTVIESKDDTIAELRLGIYPHNSLEEFKTYLKANLKPTYKYQTMSDGIRIYPHKFLRIDKITSSLYDNCLFLWDFIREEESTESAVYRLVNEIHGVKHVVGYSTDKQSFGVIEKWLTPREAYNRVVNEGKPCDCEEYMILLYTFLKRLLVLRGEWETEGWRLRCFLVNIIGSGYHASVAWVKESCADWINLETTYAEDSFGYCWANDKSLSGNWLYEIDFSFNEDNCYVKM